MKQVHRVLAYARVSGLEQGRMGTSLDQQPVEITRYCAAHGYPAPQMFTEVESGAGEKLSQRAELRALMAEVREGDLVLVTKQDRFSRDTLDYLKLTREIVKRGARFFSIAEQFDPTTPEGRFAATLMAASAENERWRIRDRMVGTRQRLRNEGRYVEGLTPVGYQRAVLPDRTSRSDPRRNKLEVVPADAEIVREVYRLCLAGWSIARIGEHLQVEHPDRHGWDKKTVQKILRARVYLGEVCDARGVWLEGTHEAIIDRATWQRAQVALDDRRLSKGGLAGGPGTRTEGWLLRDVACCGECGSKMSAVYGKTKDYYACCGRQAGRGCLARYVEVTAVEALARPHVLKRLAEVREEIATLGRDVTGAEAELNKRLEELRDQRQTAIRFALSGTITEDDLRRQLAAVDADVGRLTLVLAGLPRDLNPASRRAVQVTVDDVAASWDQVTPARRRKFVTKLAAKAMVCQGVDPTFEWFSAAEIAAQAGENERKDP